MDINNVIVSIEALTDIQECYRVARETQGLEYTHENPLTLTKWNQWLNGEESQIRVYQLRLS